MISSSALATAVVDSKDWHHAERGLACLRAHDCIEALLCRDCETGAIDRDAHSYYLTKGWLCHPGFISHVDDWMRQHSGEDAKRMLRLMFAGYEHVTHRHWRL